MINVIGLGYIGLPTALMLASHGQEVVGTDYNKELVATLTEGKTTFKEEGQLIKLYLVDILRDDLVVAGIANDIHAAEECYRRENGVRTIQQCNLTLVVGLL